MDKNPFSAMDTGHMAPNKQGFSNFWHASESPEGLLNLGSWSLPSGFLIHMSGEDLRISLPNTVAGDIDAVGLGTTL